MGNDKNISHIHMLDAFEKAKICPLCELDNASVQKYIADMLYENVNDRGLRKILRNRKGFCALHGELILKHGDALGIAIIHTEQIQLLLDYLRNIGSLYSKIVKADHNDWTDHAGCVICEIQKESEKRHIEIFIELIDDKSMRTYMESFPGFCAKHLFRTMEKLKKQEHIEYLLKLHTEKYNLLLDELKEFCRKNDYRFQNEKIGKEADSWKKAVRIVSGKIP